MKAVATTLMSVNEGCFNRTEGPTDPINASTETFPSPFIELLIELQEKGVRPGTKLKITIETIPNKKK